MSMFNPFKPNGFFHPYHVDGSILPFKSVRLILSQLFYHKLVFFQANNEDPDETSHYAMSHQGLYVPFIGC